MYVTAPFPIIKKIIVKTIMDALEYEKITGRKLGITGEVGEIFVCDKLKLRLLKDPLSAGYDAEDKEGFKYQIKSKRAIGNAGRVSSFSKHQFDYLVMILFDINYNIIGIWKTDFKTIEPIIGKHKKRNPSVREIKKVATKVY